MNKRFSLHHWLWLTGMALSLILLACGFWCYRTIWSSNFHIAKPVYIYIDEQKDWNKLCQQLCDSAGCLHINNFKILAGWMHYTDHLRTGRYEVRPGMSNIELIRALRSGQQSAIRFTFNSMRTIEEFAEKADQQLMLDGNQILHYLNDSLWCDSIGFDNQTIIAMLIPNTYELYWNISPEAFMQRMKKEYDAFWNESRRAKATEIGLTPIEVSTLASIVEEESAVVDEYPIIAGLYINRLKRGMPLQADPTVKYASGNFAIQRILNIHLEIDSPYNTYKHEGLPPGPIRIPSTQGLNAVLNYRQHNYLYMCAKEDFSGRHNFAATLSEHNRNADRYRAELNKRKIF